MKYKQKIADAFVRHTHEWNMAMHNAIERNILDAYKKRFPNGPRNPDDAEGLIESMRTFYYQRMINTGSLLLTGVSLLVAMVALIVAVIAIYFS